MPLFMWRSNTMQTRIITFGRVQFVNLFNHARICRCDVPPNSARFVGLPIEDTSLLVVETYMVPVLLSDVCEIIVHTVWLDV